MVTTTYDQKTLQTGQLRRRTPGRRQTDRGRQIRENRNRPERNILDATSGGCQQPVPHRWPAEGLRARTGRRSVASFLKNVKPNFNLIMMSFSFVGNELDYRLTAKSRIAQLKLHHPLGNDISSRVT